MAAISIKVTIPNAPKEYDASAVDDIVRVLRLAFNQLNNVRIDSSEDIIVDSITDGVVFKDTQVPPHYWRVRVSNVGMLTTTDLGTSKPN